MCVRGRKPVLADTCVVDKCIEILITECGECFAIPAYCFMPDHLHMLVEAKFIDSELLFFLARFKQRTGFWLRRLNMDFQWQRSYHDHVLRVDEGWRHIARYVLGNPVRAGIVDDALDYPFSGSIGYHVKDIIEDLMFD